MHQERILKVASGWGMLLFNLLLLVGSVVAFITGVANVEGQFGQVVVWALVTLFAGILGFVVAVISLRGHFTLQPNQAMVLILFGSYHGTARESGFFWANPFYTRRLLSLRLHNLEGAKLKVNDKQGNPIEIATVVVWRVENTAQACFDVDNFVEYVKVQSESAVRHLAKSYAYDHGEEF